ncbi:MAG: RNA methyltransferase [Vicinamibacterales bacterium]
MPVIHITTATDDRVAEYVAVQNARDPRRARAFIVEGRLGVERLLAQSRYMPRSFFLSDTAWRALAPHLVASPANVPVYVATQSVMNAVTGFEIHRGCLALVDRPSSLDAGDVLAGAAVVVALEGVANPDNVGGVFRNAAAFQVGALLLGPGCADPLYRKAIRTSMAATLVVPYASLEEWPKGLLGAKPEGFQIVALTSRAPALDLAEYVSAAASSRVLLLVGSEATGLSEAALSCADLRVRIPMSPGMDSLNLATATGIVLSRLSERTR